MQRCAEQIFLRKHGRFRPIHHPPTKRLIERYRVSEAVGTRLDHVQSRLQIGLLRIHQKQCVDISTLELLMHKIEIGLFRLLELACCTKRIGACLQRVQNIGHVLQCG